MEVLRVTTLLLEYGVLINGMKSESSHPKIYSSSGPPQDVLGEVIVSEKHCVHLCSHLSSILLHPFASLRTWLHSQGERFSTLPLVPWG